jgi:hypothetical protein
MLTRIGTTFPNSWQYGPEEIEMFDKTARQIEDKFSNERNLLINTTWFGPQFKDTNDEWLKVEKIFASGESYDNLFVLSLIDPLYLMEQDLQSIINKLSIKKTYMIGMFLNTQYEYNFHAIVGDHLMPKYKDEDVMLKEYDKDFLCYQRKPRVWRVDFADLARKNDLLGNGIMTLGAKTEDDYGWSEGRIWEPMTLDESHEPYKDDGQDNPTHYGGIPNDLVTVGSLDVWNRCFLYISSETVFNQWEPLFANERIWKSMIGLRPFVVQGNPDTYKWLEGHGFKTFNQYWPHVKMEDSKTVLDDIIQVLKFLDTKSAEEKMVMYNDMLPALKHNKNRFYEFSREQKHKMENIFR